MRTFGFTAALLALVLAVGPALAQSPEEVANDIVHSDLPIFGHGDDNEWPQGFSDQDSFGCASRVAFGDWAWREAGAGDEDDTRWYRFSNYGAFHCWANTFRADERERLDAADFYPSFFAFLETTRTGGSEVELWAVQIGARPGSEYLLLSRRPISGPVESFDVLQTDCPRASVRDAGSLDILLTRYCAINSRAELVRLARRMAQRPPLGTLTRVRDDEENDDELNDEQ
ncbi:MAG: hypothetical protein ABL883_13090 [Terricaulis sp.]